jgi:hypothetical protein
MKGSPVRVRASASMHEPRCAKKKAPCWGLFRSVDSFWTGHAPHWSDCRLAKRLDSGTTKPRDSQRDARLSLRPRPDALTAAAAWSGPRFRAGEVGARERSGAVPGYLSARTARPAKRLGESGESRTSQFSPGRIVRFATHGHLTARDLTRSSVKSSIRRVRSTGARWQEQQDQQEAHPKHRRAPVQFHADPTMLGRLAQALNRVRPVPLAT